jgi:hypothetical protein
MTMATGGVANVLYQGGCPSVNPRVSERLYADLHYSTISVSGTL